MKFNRVIIFFLVVSLLTMTILATLSCVELIERDAEIEGFKLELNSARERNDELNQLLIEEIDKKKELTEILLGTKVEQQKVISRSTINNYIVSRPSGRTKEQFDAILKNTGLANLGAAIIEAEKKYNINGIFIVAVAQLESGHGTTELAKKKNNLFGLNAWGDTRAEIMRRAFSYASKHSCIMAFAGIIRDSYLSKGRDTVEKIGAIYCEIPIYWIDKINILMEENIKKLNKLEEQK